MKLNKSVITLIIRILKAHDVKKASIFGSHARGDAKKGSDVDVLVEFKGKKSLLDLVGLEQELEDKVGKKFDLLTFNSIDSLVKDQILKEQVPLL